jgi:hypothetical protein
VSCVDAFSCLLRLSCMAFAPLASSSCKASYPDNSSTFSPPLARNVGRPLAG